MKADFSRWTFDPNNNFLRVLMQQGRAQVDADWNEQAAILLHYLQTLAADLIGPHGGPEDGGIQVVEVQNSKMFKVTAGHYFVNGLLCVNPADFVLDPGELGSGRHVVYLDVWERHINAIEDERIQEVALDGPDTATRSKVEWQPRTRPLDDDSNCSNLDLDSLLLEEDCHLSHPIPDRLDVRVGSQEVSTDPCAVPPTSAYRGVENQLYRVEIHRGGETPTFKWSRDNGSVIFPIKQLTVGDGTCTLILEHIGRDNRFGLEKGHWVEIITDHYDLNNENNTLFEVQHVDPDNLEVRLDLAGNADHLPSLGVEPETPPFLRRWDHQGSSDYKGAIVIEPNKWPKLEDGIRIQFKMADAENPAYCAGDHWLIPARTASGGVEWPDAPDGVKPYRVRHWYAPLAIVNTAADTTPSVSDCRRTIQPVAKIEKTHGSG